MLISIIINNLEHFHRRDLFNQFRKIFLVMWLIKTLIEKCFDFFNMYLLYISFFLLIPKSMLTFCVEEAEFKQASLPQKDHSVHTK